MKALVYTGPNRVEVQDIPVPEGRSGQAKVRMRYCGVCGTDIGIFAGKHPRAKAPLVLGHEFVGTIEEVRDGSGKFAPGDRVVAYPLISCGECQPCRTGHPHVCKTLKLIGIDRDGGMAGYAWIDENVLFKVPDTLSDEIAALVEPLAVIVRSLHQARFNLLDTTVVTGAGPIGVLTAIVLKHSGASRIVISDVDQARLDLCRSFGFETVNVAKDNLVEHIDATTDGEGVDIVFECSGVESAAAEMTRLARVGGTICMTGIHKAPRSVDLRDINFKEQILIGSRVYTKREFEMSVAYAETLAEDLAKVVTQTVPLSGAATVFDMIADPAVNAVKVLVDCEA
ncbi:zinc-dependent alcohol dehydrogenase [Tropicimonas sediminicola]|uniref:2-desacetyl-2-hydroxyethyl bacteriochlorophyllide A dehydrogenase n=1 Tax=Tropicimonas sediminicola TaxID=1031541 RepID=A0A239D2T4_9RHOB|nr:alcohol dehydrogenase catalytic domain-containing protein [Tropicimonas sediminicola]SNS26529.1 2-desacetyl-2-hydroxyethyl bacteriochlorophyllide A dehydrogenase [Tropicimonas sediminicola]